MLLRREDESRKDGEVGQSRGERKKRVRAHSRRRVRDARHELK